MSEIMSKEAFERMKHKSYIKGYRKGRADAIDEIKPILKGLEGSIYWYDRVCEKLKHLKEQNKCREH